MEIQVPAVWPGYEMSAGGFKLSAAPCMHYFHGNGSFQLPISCWLKALQCFVLRLQRRETISLLPQHSARDGSSSWEQKPCLQRCGVLGGGRLSREDGLPFLVENSTSPTMQKCTLTSQHCTAQPATCAFACFTTLASFGLLCNAGRRNVRP